MIRSQILDQSGSVREVMQVISPVDDLLTQKAIAQLHYCIVTFLQTVEFALGDLKKGCKPIKLNAALTIDLICVRQFFPRISGPR